MPKGVYLRTKPIWNKGLKGFRLGCKHTEETKEKISRSHMGIRPTEETKKKISDFFKGKPIKKETKEKISRTMKSRFIPPTEEEMERREDLRKIRRSLEYQRWKEEVLIRNDFVCQKCGEEDVTKLSVDHIKPMNWYPNLALDVDNGRVLCSLCHLKMKTHGYFSRIPTKLEIDC